MPSFGETRSRLYLNINESSDEMLRVATEMARVAGEIIQCIFSLLPPIEVRHVGLASPLIQVTLSSSLVGRWAERRLHSTDLENRHFSTTIIGSSGVSRQLYCISANHLGRE